MNEFNQRIESEFFNAFDTYHEAIFRYCLMRVSNKEKAKDLVQDTFIRLWNYQRKGKQIKNVRAFLYKIASNLVVDYYRKKSSASLDSMSEKWGFDPVGEVPDIELNHIDGDKVMNLLESMPDNYRDVVYMYYADDLSVTEIAQVIGETANNVSVKLHRGLKKLKHLYHNQHGEG